MVKHGTDPLNFFVTRDILLDRRNFRKKALAFDQFKFYIFFKVDIYRSCRAKKSDFIANLGVFGTFWKSRGGRITPPSIFKSEIRPHESRRCPKPNPNFSVENTRKLEYTWKKSSIYTLQITLAVFVLFWHYDTRKGRAKRCVRAA